MVQRPSVHITYPLPTHTSSPSHSTFLQTLLHFIESQLLGITSHHMCSSTLATRSIWISIRVRTTPSYSHVNTFLPILSVICSPVYTPVYQVSRQVCWNRSTVFEGKGRGTARFGHPFLSWIGIHVCKGFFFK